MGSSDTLKADSNPRQTVVELCEGSGEPPLIIIHGGLGSIHAFGPLKEKFRSALWAIQVTPDTPLSSLTNQATYYFNSIKEKQPTGPYRICAFSASSIIAFALAGLFERNQDVVSQLALLDHFPTTFLAPTLGVDVSQRSLHDPCARKEFIDASVFNLLAMTRRDGGGNVPKRIKLANDLFDAYQGRPVTPFMETNHATLIRFLNQIFDTLLFLTGDAGHSHSALTALETWLQKVKAPLTVYLGTYGMVGSVLPEHRQMWYDLRIRKSFPHAEIKYVTAGHYDILANDTVIEGLQREYLRRAKM
ncbi:hypothetical protein PLEOSDRAFT_163722 [Pleurotus ostreatus PC15]|uniref:Thioesterase domain-containing protein n=2 Tax=Pleurotus TaxID=5320 RepID=A0A067NFI3_PLEO1|nr:hypothetical protein CCMSSC00406_0002934 [Pleurotus cornucopiae]KDQ22832.1 hypothetical protein PLEOSDRAFT_163722 [Pleurotus ostreatus PC15]